MLSDHTIDFSFGRGCVTPTVLHNWNEKTQGDFEMVDGFEELPTEAQEKVKRAFEQVHVDDDEWNGVRLSCHVPANGLLTCIRMLK